MPLKSSNDSFQCQTGRENNVLLQIDQVNDMFVEARDLIEDARDEAETVYFNEACTEAKTAVSDVLDK